MVRGEHATIGQAIADRWAQFARFPTRDTTPGAILAIVPTHLVFDGHSPDRYIVSAYGVDEADVLCREDQP